MNIWIFNHHALTPDMSGGTRHFDFAKELIKRGHKVTIFASSFHYATHKELKNYTENYFIKESYDGVDFIWLKTRPYQGNGIGRVLNMLDYMFKVQNISLTCKKPDVIIGSSVHLFAVYAAYKVAKKFDVPFIMEVRDIWPQTLIDLGMSKWHPFVILLGYLEKFLYKKAAKIITLLPFAYRHIEKFGVKKENIIWISNGVDISNFIDIKSNKSEYFNVTYTGSISTANVLETLFYVAKKLDKKYNIQFNIVGDGNLKDVFKNYVKEENITNVNFIDSVSKDKIPQILADSDILYVGLKDSPLYKYGISLNKIYDYLASSKPIIFASNAENNPIDDAKAGITIPPEDEIMLQKSILKLYTMSEKERKSNFSNGFEYVKNNFSIQSLTDKLENLLNGLK
jgi:glycosyltransferase involved in cell wall biosynthesis